MERRKAEQRISCNDGCGGDSVMDVWVQIAQMVFILDEDPDGFIPLLGQLS
jgi:hypothetical protein